jgi:hypothetical protein
MTPEPENIKRTTWYGKTKNGMMITLCRSGHDNSEKPDLSEEPLEIQTRYANARWASKQEYYSGEEWSVSRYVGFDDTFDCKWFI